MLLVHVIFDLPSYKDLRNGFQKSLLSNLISSNFSSVVIVIWKPFIFMEVNELVVTK